MLEYRINENEVKKG